MPAFVLLVTQISRLHDFPLLPGYKCCRVVCLFVARACPFLTTTDAVVRLVFFTVRACRAAGRTEEALSLLETMRRSAKGERERGGDAESGEAKASALRPDAFCFNICIDACAKGRLHERARALLGVMRSDGVAPDVIRLAFFVIFSEGDGFARLSCFDH